MTEEQVTLEVQRLRRAWDAGDRADPTLRTECGDRLESLRRLFREQPRAFAAETLSTLRTISEELRQGVPLSPIKADELRRALKTTFGYDAFRPGQQAIIEAVLSGRDCVGVMPTGAGKSLTFQLPARMLPGTVLVISPLISLMKDQVDALGEAGLSATLLNSSVETQERHRRVAALRRGDYQLVYAAPEGLEASVGGALSGVRLSLIAVDEAHCISQWGHDFRPAYRNLAGLKTRFGAIPVLALTATATPEVTRDIIGQLAMVNPLVLRGSFFRPNLQLSAYKKGAEGTPRVREAILRLVQARPDQSGIIYCLSRRAVESMADYLRAQGVRARAYHAGMEAEERSSVQDAFRLGEADVIVATVAFGMGIDKPDVRFVIHRDMPRSVESYYQEIGRAGRDGLPSDCVLFYSFADVAAYDRFAEDASPEIAARHRRQTRELFDLLEHCGCRHRQIVRYLGESIEACGSSCDVCTSSDLLREAPEPLTRRAARAARRPAAADPERGERPVAFDAVDEAETSALFEQLRKLRMRLAGARKIPAYLIFSDATLLEIARRRPTTQGQLLAISGVGPKKLASYGETFLELLRRE